MAAGFTLAHARIDDFRDFLNERIGTEISEAGIKPILRLDGSLTAAGAGIAVAFR
jgi:single-stranded DNA-specific DHH superfamily exonuclease